MSYKNVDDLNHEFSLGRYLIFLEEDNGFIYAKIRNDSGSAHIYLHGAHLTSFIPLEQEPVIFLSSEAQLKAGKAIRGGVPISWPWFADHPTDNTKPAHGFARTSLWEVRDTRHLSTDETEITFGLCESEETHKLWDYSFDLELIVCVSNGLHSTLKMTNLDKEPFTISSAFHSYYNVGDISDVVIQGLNDTNYIDKVDNFTTKLQDGPVTITGETDRIFQNTHNDCLIEDKSLDRIIRIQKSGSNSTVIWNPWKENAMNMKDLGDEDYTKFVCVETTNAGDDLIELKPNEEHKLEMNISVISP